MNRRVGLVMSNLALGGAERQAVDLARYLPTLGWEVVFLLAERRGEFIEEAESLGTPIYDLGTQHWLPKSNPAFWWNLGRTTGRIGVIARRERLSLLQSFLFWEDAVTVPAARITPGVHAVITSRFNTGDFMDGRPHYKVIQRALNPLTEAVVCNSRGVKSDAVRREGLRPSKAVVIPNGVRIDRFGHAQPASVGEQYPFLAGADCLAIVVANFKPQKRHDIFLEALAAARREAPGLKALLLGSDMGTLSDARERIVRLGLEEAVAIPGAVPDPERYLAAASLFVLTSDYEGMPNALLEAMASRLPVIATRVEGSEDLVIEGKTGLLVPRGDTGAIARALVRLAKSGAERHRMGRRARQRVERHFSPEAMAARYARLYDRLVN